MSQHEKKENLNYIESCVIVPLFVFPKENQNKIIAQQKRKIKSLEEEITQIQEDINCLRRKLKKK